MTWQKHLPVLGRVLGAVGVVYAFGLILMTATAQQAITATLDGLPEPLSYSSAHARLEDLTKRQTTIESLEKKERSQAQEQLAAELKRQEIVAASETAWTEIDAAVRTVEARGVCDPQTAQERIATWHWAIHCLQNPALAASDRALLERAINRSPSAFDLHQSQIRQTREADYAYNQLMATRNELKTSQQDESLKTAFDEANILSKGRLPFTGFFVPFPPALVQIILAFASGLFGALLITLVLAVYPKSSLKFATSEGIGARIFLGGLIAMGVYIVLSGGASVLGTSEGVGTGPTNVMAFSAVGILAGMFSDRVAFWLSEKAEVFFAHEQNDPSDQIR